MSLLIAALLGVVEGLTEFLPVSSTGHLILLDAWLGGGTEATKAFDIVIQLGAVLAVAVHYRTLLATRLAALRRRDPEAVRLLAAIAIAFLPVAIVGKLFGKAIKAHLFGPVPVAAALVVGGVAMIAVDAVRRRRGAHGLDGLAHVDARRALLVGLGQCLALWPGASRSMCTIVAGQIVGLSTATAAELSFLVALPTLGAATLYEAAKSRAALATLGAAPLAVGLVVSFFVAWAVIATFLRYLGRHGLAPFGWYRIALGVVVLAVLGAR